MKPQEDAAGLPVDSLEVQAAMAGGGTGRAEPDSHSFLYYYSVLGGEGLERQLSPAVHAKGSELGI